MAALGDSHDINVIDVVVKVKSVFEAVENVP